MTDHLGRYKLQELISGEWIAFSSDDSDQFAISAAENMSQFKHRKFRVYDSQTDKVIWPEGDSNVK